MEIRSAKYTEHGMIDCEIDHPVYGWVPFTAVNNDQDQFSARIFAAALAMHPAPYIAPPLPDPLEAERDKMVVSSFQARAALMDFGLLADVNAALSKAGPLAQLAWAEAGEFRRRSGLVNSLADGFGLTEGQVDELFRHAKTIEV